MTKYPEHEKQAKIVAESQAIGEFLDFGLAKQGLYLCEADNETYRTASGPETHFFPTHKSIPSILAQYFGIDQTKIDAEKEQMLRDLRAQNLRA